MVRNRVKMIAAGLVAVATFSAPASGLAQGYRSVYDERSSVAVQCAPGQRAIMAHRPVNRGAQVSARCEAAPSRVARRSNVQYVERVPERTKTKSALMIAGSAAAGAGVGGALGGTKGALIGAAIGGGSASIYEAAKRR